MKEDEVNKLILEKVKTCKADDKIKDFLIEILRWEKTHEQHRYREDYFKMIDKYSVGYEGEDSETA